MAHGQGLGDAAIPFRLQLEPCREVNAENGYPLDSSDHYMLWLVCLVLVRHDDLAVGNGINRRGLLDKSIEQLAPVP